MPPLLDTLLSIDLVGVPDEETARQLLLRLRERWIRRELKNSEGVRARELQEELIKLQVEIPSLG